MRHSKKEHMEIIELFDEKTKEIIRTLRFKKTKDLEYFITSFRLMRYPGYGWRYQIREERR
jgi:hypothetical protein